MESLLRTVLFDQHVALGASMVPFGGWEMPVQYPAGIIQEHLATRCEAGLFDVSHMGRLTIGGRDALAFLQRCLTNNAAALEPGQSQYTLVADENGGAIDDAYLYRFVPDRYRLVVNAANREKVWSHLHKMAAGFEDLTLSDDTLATAMLSLQGPQSKTILQGLLTAGSLPDPLRNALSSGVIGRAPVDIGRTGYTGEPLCFEIFTAADQAAAIWQALIAQGARPVGLGARDTLRLEAGLPLYGHELGPDPEGGQIPIFASPLARFAVSFSPVKGDFVGREALGRQQAALVRILNRDYGALADLPRRILAFQLQEKGVARAGCPVWQADRRVGTVTSATMVPYWKFSGEGVTSIPTGERGMRAIGLALLDSRLFEGDGVDIEIRGRRTPALIVAYNLRSEAPPYARPILCPAPVLMPVNPPAVHRPETEALDLLGRAVANTEWRQRRCINLIPSEMTASRAVRWLSILDPAGRYAEHKAVKAFCEAEVFYYQGTGFIAEVERLLQEQMGAFLGARRVEVRPISGQMANTTVFSAMVDYINRADRKREQRRIGKIFNHHIIRGGHLSAQPMGALRDFVARDPATDRPAVVNFPVRADDPFEIDLAACADLFEVQRPELVILGRSMTLYREPVRAMRRMIDALGLDCVLMYDMAHVLGLAGPHFQRPFEEGADLVTGSTHKTFFGPQRGVVAADWPAEDRRDELWQAISRRAFPGSVSNHHLGTLVGLLMAAYEMNAFKDAYQVQVLANARALAKALASCGLEVAGDPQRGYTETHQVVVRVGYGRGPQIARRLEENNIIVNYQATPEEEGFTASGALRLGVAEMTRFGMQATDFETLAQLMAEVIRHDRPVAQAVADLRVRFLDLHFCFDSGQIEDRIAGLVRVM